ncbi:MAG TPA: 16S rRNA (cytidine(1402)-2'-O)-methyltransferase [Pyrinomonadaceae bacterium]|nr:16S rRNA (cytidine(1402)-2'-O)-methyltransferase [Pyrinomonadaceae bacterium]
MAGTLYIVATPIGNLEDLTFRALRILGEVDLIACEDTRHTRKLLNHYGIKNRTISYHEHNERERARELIALLKTGKDVAVVSDAGTPGINDPGFRVVQLALEHELKVVAVPGATAMISALVSSGLPTDQFFFGGFLPPRGSARRARLVEVCSIPATLIFFEAPHRILETLKDAQEILGDREAVIARELTKIHEQFLRGALSRLTEELTTGDMARGEIVLMIGRSAIGRGSAKPGKVAAAVASFEAEGLNSRMALKKAARELGISRDEAYRRLIAERGKGG